MDELNDLLKPVWGAQKWIAQGWDKISEEERQTITARTHELFKNGLPFELKHDKLVYIYIFSLLAQLEVLAIQIPLNFESEMPTLEFQQRMHVQLLDEIFHGIIFTKIVYLLSEPYAFPPSYNENAEKLCDFVRAETCPKMAIVLLNLIAEGWVEEVFKALQPIAPQVFDIILEDERRHVSEAELYREIGLPDIKTVTSKQIYLEQLFLATIFMQYNIGLSFFTVLGPQGTYAFLNQLDCKYQQQLEKLHLKPSKKWDSGIHFVNHLIKKFESNLAGVSAIKMTAHRKMAITQWDNPTDPTMVGQFNIDVTCLDFFNKKYPPETLTILILQTMSQLLADNPEYQFFLREKKIYQHHEVFVSLVVKLPMCDGHLGLISFHDCHAMSVQELLIRIEQTMALMCYCYKKVEQLEKAHPHLILLQNAVLNDMNNPHYPHIPMPPTGVSLSNIGVSGYAQAKSPLLPNEATKVTLLAVERRPIWNQERQAFEARDMLPVSVSVDHRVFDGNMPLPKLMGQIFQEVFQRMESGIKTAPNIKLAGSVQKYDAMVNLVEQFLEKNLEMGYMTLAMLHTICPSYISLDDFFDLDLPYSGALPSADENRLIPC